MRADSWAAGLTDENREELLAGYEYSLFSAQQAAEKASDMQGRPVSASMFVNWFQGQRASWLNARAKAAADLAAREAPANLDEAQTLAIRQAAFAKAFEQLSGAEIAALERNTLQREKLRLEQERLRLDREKFEEAKRRAAQADEAEGVLKDRKLPPEEREQRLLEIFGIA